MLVETDNIVTAEELRKQFDKFLDAARDGRGPIAVTRDSEIVGFFVAPEEYEALFGAAVKKLLAGRTAGRKVTHEEARSRVRRVARRLSRS